MRGKRKTARCCLSFFIFFYTLPQLRPFISGRCWNARQDFIGKTNGLLAKERVVVFKDQNREREKHVISLVMVFRRYSSSRGSIRLFLPIDLMCTAPKKITIYLEKFCSWMEILSKLLVIFILTNRWKYMPFKIFRWCMEMDRLAYFMFPYQGKWFFLCVCVYVCWRVKMATDEEASCPPVSKNMYTKKIWCKSK